MYKYMYKINKSKKKFNIKKNHKMIVNHHHTMSPLTSTSSVNTMEEV